MEPAPPPPPGTPFQFMLICSSTALNAKASACVSVTRSATGPARSLPESALSAHRETEVSGNLCCSKGGLWRGYRQSRSPAPDWVTPRCDLQSLQSSSRGIKQRHPRGAGDGYFKDEHSSASHPVFFCSVIWSNAR